MNKAKITPLIITIISLSFCIPYLMDISGKWSGFMKIPTGDSVKMIYDFKQNGEKLTGSVQGPDGTLPISDGIIKDSVFSFALAGQAEGAMVQTGKFYGDSISTDLEIHGMKFHLKLLKVQDQLKK